VDIYLKLITKNNNRHSKCDEIIAAFMYDFESGNKKYINFKHGDIIIDDTFDNFKKKLNRMNDSVYVNNKKKYRYWLDCNLVDVNIFGFIENNRIIDISNDVCESYFSIHRNKLNDFNLIVPYVVHQRIFDEEVKLIKNINLEEKNTYCFKFFNDVVSDTLYQVEKNGLKVDRKVYDKFFDAKVTNGFVYSDYHIYNPTGRPSNAFDGINYVALKKDDGSRASFVSRYENGYLMMVDFMGFHPYIVANMIKYEVPYDETIYEHLAKYYYNVDDVSHVLLNKSKKLTMVNLYGQINKQYMDIPFFKLVEKLKNKYWEMFEKNGYVITPIYKRKITRNHISDANKNKLFAYIIQAAETEYGIDRLNACNKFISGKQILPILYTYDAMLFDVGNVESNDIQDLIKIIENKKFKVRVYKGKNYNDLIQI